jgi:hypothetical protein
MENDGNMMGTYRDCMTDVLRKPQWYTWNGKMMG